jgi:EmrB/QacA subfamily drug resistance transporter
MSQPSPKQRESLRFRRFLHAGEPAPAAIIARQPWHPEAIIAVTCIGAFIGQLDASIVQLALPSLADVFDASVSDVSWVSLGYLLAFASFLPVFARLCEMFGRKLLYIAGFALFSLATALCGFAPTLTWLIIFRILQGIGGALLGANSIAVLVKSIDPARRGRALGVFAAVQAVGISAGPLLGGLLLGNFGWRWLFWVTVPFGVTAVVAGWYVLPRTESLPTGKPFDWLGAVLLMPALTAFILALNQVTAWGPASPYFIFCLVATIVLMALLVRHEGRTPFPLLDLRLLRSAAFSFDALAVLLGYAMLYSMFFLMSFVLIRGFHDSAEHAGLRLAVIPIAIGAVAPLSGALSARLPPRLVRFAGMAICVLALLFLAIIALQPTVSRTEGTMAVAVFGAGLGAFIPLSNLAAISHAPPALASEAGGMLNLMRVLGTSLGVASTASMLSWRFYVLTGAASKGDFFSGRPLLGAVESSFLMLAVFAAVAAILSMVRDPKSA